MGKIKTVQNQQEIPYKCIQFLGQGSFAEVWMAQNKDNGKKYAIKKLQVDPLAQVDQEDTCRQIQRLKSLKGDHIIEYYESYKFDREIWIVMRLCNGSLRDLMDKKQQFKLDQILAIIVQITNAMILLDRNNTRHLDLKPENILCLNENDTRLSDFGCAELAAKGSFSKLSGGPINFGTYIYISPQIKLNQGQGFRSSQDVWSLGVIAYELLYGVRPISDDDNDIRKFWQQKKQIKYPRVSQQKKNLVGFIKELLQIKPQRRPNWKQVAKKLVIYLGRHQVQFISTQDAYHRYISTSQMFILVISLIKKYENGHVHQFWAKYTKQLQQTLICLMFLYSKKFRNLFGFKMNDKIVQKQMKQFIQYEVKISHQIDRIFKQNPSKKPSLKQLEQYENRLGNLLQMARKEIENDKEQWKSLKKIWIFCKQAEELPQKDFFCCIIKFPQTYSALSIQI